MEQQVFYAYRYPKLKRERIVTIAFTKTETELSVGTAFCSIHDQFEKKMGRKIATGRLSRQPTFNDQPGFAFTKTFAELGLSEKPTMKEIVEFLRENIYTLTGTKL